MSELRIRLPDDFHVHLRQGPALAAYVARTATHFGRFLAMPNVVPPLVAGAGVSDYRRALTAAVTASGYSAVPLSSFKLVPGMGREAVLGCAAAGAIAGKYYPAGSTTNASDGIPDPGSVADELAAMEDSGLVLSIHGEDPLVPCLERERAFLPVVDRLVARYPGLRIVVEHVSTIEAVEAVQAWPVRVAATITAHHLSYTIDDLLGDRLDPGYYCKPLLKTAKDRHALVEAAVSGSPRFFFGSDSAPHIPAAKASGAAGSYSAPVAMSLLAAVFEEAGAFDRLEGFCSEAGAGFYGLGRNHGLLALTREPWTVPVLLDGVTPLAAGRMLSWVAERVP
jgi:dihydroorotase